MRRAVALILGALLALAPAGAAGQDQGSVAAWDGVNPFHCTLQMAGFGSTVPDPGADPYCVDFDKRHQNVDQLGVVDFLSKEPARVAAAGPKCFYFQSDHWRGSIVQSDGATKTYEWDGHYFFDKARGAGGAWVTNFNINGHTADPSAIPGIPQQYSRYLGPGTGGVIAYSGVQADPACAAKAAANPASVYARPYAAPSTAPPPPLPCAPSAGSVTGHSLGRVAIGDQERRVRSLLGPPEEVSDGYLRYCVTGGGGRYLVGEPGSGSGEAVGDATAPSMVLMTTVAGYRLHGIGPGSTLRALLARFENARLALRVGATRFYAIHGGAAVLFGVRARRVTVVAVYDRSRIGGRSRLRGYLRRADVGG